MVYVFLCNYNHSRDYINEYNLIRFLSKEKQEKFTKNKNKKSFLQSVIGELLTRIIFCKLLKLENKSLVFKKDDFNKPFLESAQGWDFNISHSGEWIVCVFSRHCVGVDLEQVKQRQLGIAQQYFSDDEYTSIINQDTSNQLIHFYRILTLKESYIKATGKGLKIPLNSFCIKGDDYRFYMQANDSLPKAYFQHYNVGEHYLMSICAFEEFSSHVTFLEINELVDLSVLLNFPEELSMEMERLNKSVSTFSGEGRFSMCC
ncbi:4'-phosphopantetheinyl transferase family protein [Paenibacillus sp. TSA_86.1]|uniref:4'-phosphopantetheinyl transferase family protein n=1 Tax=Paenibacillus sp. TSA_86.1 TaxID=3415649 RepID=UPI004045FAF9